MEIHSSSLASIPARYNAKNKNDESRLINIVEKNIDSPKKLSLTLPPPSGVDKAYESNDFLELTDKINQQGKPINSRTSRALNSYIQEDIKPLKDKRSELISSIDYFV